MAVIGLGVWLRLRPAVLPADKKPQIEVLYADSLSHASEVRKDSVREAKKRSAGIDKEGASRKKSEKKKKQSAKAKTTPKTSRNPLSEPIPVKEK